MVLTALAAASAPPPALAQAAVVLRFDTLERPAGRDHLVTLDLHDVRLDSALQAVARQADVTLTYSASSVPVERRVTVQVTRVSAADAFRAALRGTGFRVLWLAGNQAAVVREATSEAPPQTGTVVGRVTDSKTGQGIAAATITLEATSFATHTSDDGRFRFSALPPGTYTLTARQVGYDQAVQSVSVVADSISTVHIALEPSVATLSETVVTGTIVPTAIKAVPTPVSVISDSDIAAQRPNTIQDLLRQAIPSAVSWDVPGVPDLTALSARGTSSLGLGAGQLKVFIDGIEVANNAVAAIDPNSIARMEVVRGPQAAAIYGSDAIGGVISVFTKRGDSTLTRPRMSLEAAVGDLETPYTGFRNVARQSYKASVQGGSSNTSYNVGLGYSRTGDFLPNGELSAVSSPSVYGGMHIAQGIVSVGLSARYLVYDEAQNANPAVLASGFSFVSRPFYEPIRDVYQSIGAHVGLAMTSWWQANATLGLDRVDNDAHQVRPRLTSPADTFLTFLSSAQVRTSVGINSSAQVRLSAQTTMSLTVGVDHWVLPISQFSTAGAIQTSGTIETAPGQPLTGQHTTTTNTGEFAQAQVAFDDALFLTLGARLEQNSDFGDSIGTSVAPRVGISYVHSVGQTTIKLRSSYGTAIRPPSPGLKLSSTSAALVQLGNPGLGPERQKGWDGGVDVIFGRHGSLALSYFDQTADNLIQQVFSSDEAGALTAQWQNVGRVKNTGLELEGTLPIGSAQLKAQYAYVRARVDRLAAGYAGELRVGDQAEMTPKQTAGISLSVRPFAKTSVAAGMTYVGSWSGLDLLGFYRCLGGTGTCQNATFALDHSYLLTYPGFTKVSVNLTRQFSQALSAFIAVDNLGNSSAQEFLNNRPQTGRTSTIGLRFEY